VSKDTILALVFKLVQSAEKRWLRIRVHHRHHRVDAGPPGNASKTRWASACVEKLEQSQSELIQVGKLLSVAGESGG
jgi:hypothetical protein